jgi:hypothetical protein
MDRRFGTAAYYRMQTKTVAAPEAEGMSAGRRSRLNFHATAL